MQTNMCLTKCWALNLHKKQEEKKWVLHDRATSAISTNTAIVPCSGHSYHSSPPGKKFQWAPDTQTVFLPQRSLCLNPPQVTRSILANLDISMEPFHHIFFFQVQIISRNLLEIQRKLCIDKVSAKSLNKYHSRFFFLNTFFYKYTYKIQSVKIGMI